MTTTDYLINAGLVLLILRQARERELTLGSLVAPLLLVLYVGHIYVRTIPTSGNDLVLLAALATVGLTSGLISGYTTHIRLRSDGAALARVGWIAGGLLIAGVCARMLFVFAVNNGAGPAIRDFSITHHISAAAWPASLVAMALLEVAARLVIVHLRGRRLTSAPVHATIAVGVGA